MAAPEGGMIVVWAVTGCGPTICFCGTTLSAYFPHDGQREALYLDEDPMSEPWNVYVEKAGVRSFGGVDVVTFDWTGGDARDPIGTVSWSSDDGIHVYGYSVAAEAEIRFDTPIALAADYMLPGDAVVTETNGWTVISTLVGREDCPVAWGLAWEDCVHLHVDDGDGDDSAGLPFAGDYHLVERYGPAWMHLTGYTEKLNLLDYDWSPEE